VDVNIKEVENISPVTVEPVEISSVDKVEKIAPVAVHVKELNQIAPLQIETMRIDRVREIDPLAVDRLNVTRLPVVNLSVNQVPEVPIAVSRVPPVAILLQQCFDLPSDYVARARFLGLEFLQLRVSGRTRVIPHERARPARIYKPSCSFPLVTTGGPALADESKTRCAGAAAPGPRAVYVGKPRFAYVANR